MVTSCHNIQIKISAVMISFVTHYKTSCTHIKQIYTHLFHNLSTVVFVSCADQTMGYKSEIIWGAKTIDYHFNYQYRFLPGAKGMAGMNPSRTARYRETNPKKKISAQITRSREMNCHLDEL